MHKIKHVQFMIASVPCT